MKQLVEFPLEDGGTILVEIDDADTNGIRKVSRSSDMFVKAQITFDQALEKVKPVASSIIQKLRSLHDEPDEVQVEFGLKFNCEAGAFVASTGIEANYRVTLVWKKPETK